MDEQGQRLANAESKLTVHTDELSSQAQRLDGLAAQVAGATRLFRPVSQSWREVTAERRPKSLRNGSVG